MELLLNNLITSVTDAQGFLSWTSSLISWVEWSKIRLSSWKTSSDLCARSANGRTGVRLQADIAWITRGDSNFSESSSVKQSTTYSSGRSKFLAILTSLVAHIASRSLLVALHVGSTRILTFVAIFEAVKTELRTTHVCTVRSEFETLLDLPYFHRSAYSKECSSG